MGPAIYDYNKRLNLLSVIQLSGGNCIFCIFYEQISPITLIGLTPVVAPLIVNITIPRLKCFHCFSILDLFMLFHFEQKKLSFGRSIEGNGAILIALCLFSILLWLRNCHSSGLPFGPFLKMILWPTFFEC